jgi:hypothetical protein
MSEPTPAYPELARSIATFRLAGRMSPSGMEGLCMRGLRKEFSECADSSTKDVVIDGMTESSSTKVSNNEAVMLHCSFA